MKKYLIFRTDRVGDFIVTSILLKKIKKNDPKSYINVVCSINNYNYIKQLSFIDNAILYPNTFFQKINFYFLLFRLNFDCILSLDGKKRSILNTIFLKSNLKIFSITKKI